MEVYSSAQGKMAQHVLHHSMLKKQHLKAMLGRLIS